MRTCPLNRRPVSEDMAQTTERQGAGKTIKRPPCACTEGEAFRLTVRRQPGTAISGFSLLSLYTTNVRVRVSADKAVWALPPSFTGHLVPSRDYSHGICDKVCFTQKSCLPSRLLHFTSANTVSIPHQASPRHAHSRRRDLRHSASAYR